MELSGNTSAVIRSAWSYAKDHRNEYVTPETILLSLCGEAGFQHSFSECGGDLGVLREDLKNYLSEYNEGDGSEDPAFSTGANIALSLAAQSASNSGREEIGIGHLLHGIWQIPDSFAVYYVKRQGIEEEDLLRSLTGQEEEGEEYVPAEEDPETEEERAPSYQRDYAPCLNDTLEDVNPLIGRELELSRVIQILCRKDKNNPLLIGEPGVGKTAVVYGLVQKIREGSIPDAVKNLRVFALDLGGLLAGTQYRGDFEKRIKRVLKEIEKEEAPVIFIDEIHNLSGAGAVSSGSFDASNMLKPYLSEGHIRFIGATTFDEYKKHFEKNKSLVRRFQNVEIREPGEEEAVSILEGLKKKYEDFHGVAYQKGVTEYAVQMSAKHIHERFLPDKAIDLMDEAGAYRRLHPLGGTKQTVGKDVVSEILTAICRVPVEAVETEELEGLSTLESRMKQKIFGQDEAVTQVVNAIKFSHAGLQEEQKPLASLLFAGPTGVGKTEVARRLAEELGVKLIRFDMSEYTEKHSVAKLIGAPAGYVGYEEGGLLTEEIRKNPSSVLLLDEIEKAHPDIYQVLLQVMDDATLTDNQGRKADFRNVILIMTSNAGADRIGKMGIGFEQTDPTADQVMEAVKQIFRPEFRNRLNRIVVFRSMDEAMAEQVTEKKLAELKDLLSKQNIVFEADQKAKELIRERGISREFGAREIDRVIRNQIKPLFVDEILFGGLKKGGKLRLGAKDGAFIITVGKRTVKKKEQERNRKGE